MVCVTAPIVMHLRHLLCTIFDRKTACNFFQILFASHPPPPKNHSEWDFQKSRFGFDSKNPPREWILWIHDPFLDLPKKAKKPFLDSEILILIFLKKTHTKYRRFREGSFAAHSRFYAWFPRLFDCNITVGAATPLTSKNSLVTKKSSLFWCSPFAIFVNRI